MGKRKSDRLEEMFQDIDSEFYGITEDIAKLRIRDIEDYIVKTNETKIRELEERIAKKQALIEELQGKDGAENSTRIQNVIKTAEEELKEAQEQLKAQKTCVSRMEKEKTYIQGYARNSSQIKQIRAFKESIAKKIPAEIKKRDERITYYKIKYPEHNLVRTKAQFKLLQSVEANTPEMIAFINECLLN